MCADKWTVAILTALGLMLAAAAWGAPPPGSDPTSPESRWFRGLRIPGTGLGWCSESDCKRTQARRTDEGWEALNENGEWLKIPPERVLTEEAHPGGASVLCALGRHVFCFVPPQGGW
jgi:hypothetical protein